MIRGKIMKKKTKILIIDMIVAFAVFVGALFCASALFKTTTAKADDSSNIFFDANVSVGQSVDTIYQMTFTLYLSESYYNDVVNSGKSGWISLYRSDYVSPNESSTNGNPDDLTFETGELICPEDFSATDGLYSFTIMVRVDAGGVYDDVKLRAVIDSTTTGKIAAVSSGHNFCVVWKGLIDTATQGEWLDTVKNHVAIYDSGIVSSTKILYFVSTSSTSVYLHESNRVLYRAKRYALNSSTGFDEYCSVGMTVSFGESATADYWQGENGTIQKESDGVSSTQPLEYIDFFAYGQYIYARINDVTALKAALPNFTRASFGCEQDVELATLPESDEYILSLQNEILELKAELQSAKSDLLEKEKEITQLKLDKATLEGDIEDLNAEIVESGNALLELESTIDELQQSLSDKTEDLEYAQEEISRYEAQAKELNWQIEQLGAMRDELQSSLDAKNAYIEQLEYDVSTYETQTKELNYQLGELEQELADAKAELGADKEDLFNKWQDEINKNQALQDENDSLKAENEALKNEKAEEEKKPTVTFGCSGCNSTIDGAGAVILCVLSLAIAFMMIRKRKDEK